MKLLLTNRVVRKLLFLVSLLVFSFSISCAQEYQHTLLKPYGFDMLATENNMLIFLSDFEIEPYVYYNKDVHMTTIEPSNQVIHEQLNLDYAVVYFKNEIMAIGLYNKDSSYLDFLVKEYGPGDSINRNDLKNESKWEIDGYIVRAIIVGESDLIYSIRSINVDKKYDLFLEEKMKDDPYF